MGLVVVYLLANIVVGAIACFFGKRLFYVVLGLLVFSRRLQHRPYVH